MSFLVTKAWIPAPRTARRTTRERNLLYFESRSGDDGFKLGARPLESVEVVQHKL